jgi:hypothetical protein
LALVDYLHELRRQDEGVVMTGKPLVADPFQVPEYTDTQAKTRVAKLKYGPGESPVIAYVRSLGMDALVASQVAVEVGCSVEMVRKLQKNPDLKAPSFEVPYGRNKIYLYTPEDVEEIRQHLLEQRKPRARK